MCVCICIYTIYMVFDFTIRVGQWQCIKMLIQQCPIPGHIAHIGEQRVTADRDRLMVDCVG